MTHVSHPRYPLNRLYYRHSVRFRQPHQVKNLVAEASEGENFVFRKLQRAVALQVEGVDMRVGTEALFTPPMLLHDHAHCLLPVSILDQHHIQTRRQVNVQMKGLGVHSRFPA